MYHIHSQKACQNAVEKINAARHTHFGRGRDGISTYWLEKQRQLSLSDDRADQLLDQVVGELIKVVG